MKIKHIISMGYFHVAIEAEYVGPQYPNDEYEALVEQNGEAIAHALGGSHIYSEPS